MNWRFKALVQNFIDKLPEAMSHPIYYKVQRYFGGLRKINPMRHFQKSIDLIEKIRSQNYDVTDKTFLEIGTGRTISVPIGLWLCGASKIISVDLNKYLKEELVIESVNFMKAHKDEVQNLFGDLGKTEIFRNRYSKLMSFNVSLDKLLEHMNIEYLAPADASSLPIDESSIDFHFSTNVFEHIPRNVIKSILSEAKRVLSQDGLFVHLIDLSDHFSHVDESITTINFLRYNEKDWNKLAGNKFMFHNRLRKNEFLDLFDKEGAILLSKEQVINERALNLLNKGFPLDKRFVDESFENSAVSKLALVGKFNWQG